MKQICFVILLFSNLLNAQIRSDFFLTTGFGPAAISADVNDNIHVVWTDGDNHLVYYQLFDSLMNPKRDRINLSSNSNNLPEQPSLAVNNNYVITVWDAVLYGITRWGVFGRALKINGDTLSSQLRIDYQDASISIEKNPDVILINDTTFWVTWIGNGNFGEVYTLIGRSGNVFSGPLGYEIYMSEDLPPFADGIARTVMNNQTSEFFSLFGVVLLEDTSQTVRYYYRIFDPDGTPKTPSTLIFENMNNYKIWEPHVAYNPAGKYTIIWSEKIDSVTNLKMVNYNLIGEVDGDTIQINSDSNIVSSYPSIDIGFSSGGESIVVWEAVDNGKVRIYGQRFLADGTKLGGNFKISTDTINFNHYWPTVQLYDEKILTLWYTYIDSTGDHQLWANILDFNNPVINVKNIDNGPPLGFLIDQNYPNPFNPETTIQYEIPEESYVTIKVYDLLGREIEELLNEEKPAGRYEVKFNAGNLASGVYFYNLQTPNYLQTRKMIVVK